MLAVVAVLLSLVGAFYYLRVVKMMYFDEPVDAQPIVASGDVRALLSANGAAVLLFGMLPGGLMAMCAQAIVKRARDLSADGRCGRRRRAARDTASSRRQVYRGHFLDVRRDKVRLPDGARRRANTSSIPAR